MNKKKFRKLALKGICGGLLMTAPGLTASQSSEAMANFIANSSGQNHSAYFAGGCGGGNCGGKVAYNETSCSGHAQNYYYSDQYRPQSCHSQSCNSQSSWYGNYSSCNSQPQGSWQKVSHGCGGTHGCGGSHGCGGGQSQNSWNNNPSQNPSNTNQPQNAWNNSQPQNSWNTNQPQSAPNVNQPQNAVDGQTQSSWYQSNSQQRRPNQIAYTTPQGDEVQVEYDNNQAPNANRANQANALPNRQGQVATGNPIPRSLDDPYSQQNANKPNRQMNQQGQGQNNPFNQRQQNQGQLNNSGKIPGQLAAGVITSSQKLTENDLKAQLNEDTKADFDHLSTEGKALALKLASQDCKGKNGCKGENSCKSKSNSCAGQGGCKGTAEKNFQDKNVAVKVAKLKMAEKRNNAANPMR